MTPRPAQKHASPLVYLLVWVALLGLTALSFLLSRALSSGLEMPVALLIAVIKSVLVGLFFMHLLEEHPRTLVVPIVAAGFIALLVTLVVTDVVSRRTFPRAPLPMEAPAGLDLDDEGKAGPRR